MVIAVSGKGGTGKSTMAALIVRHFLRQSAKPVLAVDADPNSNLGDKLGLQAGQTIGHLRERAVREKHNAPAGTPRQRTIEYDVQQAIAEGTGFDLLVMGRGEGPDCYCAVNNILRGFLHGLSSGYRHVVIDNEAGMEHLSRRTNDKVDVMLIVSDQTPTGLKSARRIAELAEQLGVVRGRTGLIVNRVAATSVSPDTVSATGLGLAGEVPADPLVEQFDLQGQPLLALPDESPAARAVAEIMDNFSG